MVMLITGTSRGIGRYLVQYFVKQGLQVIGCSRSEVDYEIDNYIHYCLDITDESKIKQMVLEIRRKFKRIDILINNAAIMSTNYVILTPLKTVQNILNTNISGTFLMCREVGKIMKMNNFGRIINFTSISSPLNIEGESIYAASKSAIITFTKILSKEFGQYGITVNAIGPSIINTDIISSISEGKKQAIIGRQAVHRMGEMRDVANIIDFFIKPESDFVTGQVIFLGGFS